VKCGSLDAPQRRNNQFVWTPPWVYVLVLISPIVVAIVAMIGNVLWQRRASRRPTEGAA
jgi:hypothetical protein